MRQPTAGLSGWSGLLAVVLSVTSAVGQDAEAAAGVSSSDRRRSGVGGLRYSVDEELLVGTRVADVVADAGLRKHGVDALTTMRFRLLNQPTGGLVIGETSGVLTVGSRLDREQLCPDRDDLCQIRLDVAVQPMAYFQIIKVQTVSELPLVFYTNVCSVPFARR